MNPTIDRAPVAATVAMAAGCALLMARPLLYQHGPPTTVVVVLFGGLLAAGVLWPLRDTGTQLAPVLPVALAGTVVIAAGRVLTVGPSVAPVAHSFVLLTVLAAVAEEAFFRRLMYAQLTEHGGPLLAVVGSTALFALVHVAIYGMWVLPLDIAAGAVFGWQRWVTGSWVAPAFTHVVANLLMVV